MKVPQRTNKGNQSINRYKGGRPKAYETIKLPIADAELLRQAVGDLDLAVALERIAASAAADLDATKAALAPLIAVEAWDGEEIL